MNLPRILERLRGLPGRLRRRAQRGETADQRAARKYWDKRVADDRERRL